MVEIVVNYCENYEMASMTVNGDSMAYGNFWDWHPDNVIPIIKTVLTIAAVDYTMKENLCGYAGYDCEFCKEFGYGEDSLNDDDEDDDD